MKLNFGGVSGPGPAGGGAGKDAAGPEPGLGPGREASAASEKSRPRR